MFPTVALPRPHRVDQIANSKFTLETQQSQLEMININKETLRAHQAGANTMHRVTREMGGVEAVEELMDNIEEGMQARMVRVRVRVGGGLTGAHHAPDPCTRPSTPRPHPRLNTRIWFGLGSG